MIAVIAIAIAYFLAVTEGVQLAIVALIGGMVTGFLTSIAAPVALHILKERSDAAARRAVKEEAAEARLLAKEEAAAARLLAKEEAEAARAIINAKLDENTKLTAEVKEEAVASRAESKEATTAANNLTGKIADSIKLVETAAVLIAKAPSKAEPVSQLGDSAKNPMHVTDS